MNTYTYPEAKEFEYNGIKFRSKLIARWAVFFDEIGISYEYEPECFVLSDSLRFIPTFKIKVYCPNNDEYVTFFVKVTRGPLFGYTLDQVKKLARQTKEEVMVLEGPPDYVNYLIYSLINKRTVKPYSFTFEPTKFGLDYTYNYEMLDPEDMYYQSQLKIDAINKSKALKVELGK